MTVRNPDKYLSFTETANRSLGWPITMISVFLLKYGWTQVSAKDRSWPVARLAGHPRRRVRALIGNNMTPTRTAIPRPPMRAMVPIGIDVVASTPDQVLLGHPLWRLRWGWFRTPAANPLRVLLPRRITGIRWGRLIAARHLNVPSIGHSAALNSASSYSRRHRRSGIQQRRRRPRFDTRLT